MAVKGGEQLKIGMINVINDTNNFEVEIELISKT